MNPGSLSLASLPVIWLLMPLLFAVIVCDLRLMRIPHVLISLLALLFVFSVPFSVPTQELLWRILAASIVFSIGFAAFAAGKLGGGDVKILPVMILFVAPGDWPLFALFLSGGSILGLVGVRMLRGAPPAWAENWRGIALNDRYPLGPGIGLAGIGYALIGPQVALLF